MALSTSLVWLFVQGQVTRVWPPVLKFSRARHPCPTPNSPLLSGQTQTLNCSAGHPGQVTLGW